MFEKAKSSFIIFIILIALSLSLVGVLFFFLQKEHGKNIELQGQLDEVKTRLRVTETNLSDYKQKSSDLESKLKLTEDNIDKLKNDLLQEQTQKAQAQSQLEQLKQDLEQQKSLRSDLEKKFNQSQDEVKKIQSHVKELDDKKAELEAKVADLENKQAATEPQEQNASSGVELGNIVVNPEAKSAVAPVPAATGRASVVAAQVEKPKKKTSAASLEGKVLVVNKNYNFVVINLGVKDGVNIGNLFSIYRDDKYIGDVKVEKVHDTMSAAGFVSADIRDKVNEGDRVTPKAK